MISSLRRYLLVVVLSTLVIQTPQAAPPAKFYSVQVSATAQVSPPQLTLSWPVDTNATSYAVSRKTKQATSWTAVTTLPGSATSYVDGNVTAGSAFEYKLLKTAGTSYTGYGYIYAGINVPLTDTRGKLVLIVENTYAADLATELSRLQQDLVGDGWTVLRHDVNRADSVTSVKALIKSDYDADPANVGAVFLFGRVPVPYSGNIAPDGHPNHQGAWPADVYYGVMGGTWTDSSVNTTNGEQSRNWNLPGDGKFDQSLLPADSVLQVGRVDLANMTCFSNKTPSRDERALLRQYLNKDHNFRHRVFTAQRRAFLTDNFIDTGFDPVAGSGWRNFSAFFGANNINEFAGGNFFPTLDAQSYLCSYGSGGGQYYTCFGVGSSDDFATNDARVVFTMMMGSYFGDWDTESDILRAPLGGTSYTLTCTYSGAPQSYYHHMALGETIGYGIRLTQNNTTNGLYVATQGSREVHIALMGDPTLRLHPVIPPSGLSASGSGSVTLTWTASTDTALQGYHIYRAVSPNGPFTRLTASPVAFTTYSDSPASGTYTYMVRAIKLEQSGSGTYYNSSQGIFVTASTSASGTVPAAPSNPSATAVSSSQINLAWADNSANETSFRVERKTGAGGTYAEIASLNANSVSFSDTGLAPATQYFYRVRASNSSGFSSYTAEVSATTAGVQASQAAVTFVGADSTTQGTWTNAYGMEGYQVIGASSSLPGYALVAASGQTLFVWADPTTDPRAPLKNPRTPDRIAATWYASTVFTVDLNLTDTNVHRVSLYLLDWDNSGRAETITLLDAATGNTLDTQSASNFGNGRYYSWDIRGHVSINLTRTAGFNSVLMGIFFGGGSLAPVQLSRPASSAGTFGLRLNGQAGSRFVIDATSDFSAWIPVLTNTFSGASFDFLDPDSASLPRRFYRVRSVP